MANVFEIVDQACHQEMLERNQGRNEGLRINFESFNPAADAQNNNALSPNRNRLNGQPTLRNEGDQKCAEIENEHWPGSN